MFSLMGPKFLSKNKNQNIKKAFNYEFFTIFLLSIFFCSLLSCVDSSENSKENSHSKPNRIIDIDQEYWEETLSQNIYVFILFYKKNSRNSEEVLFEFEKSSNSKNNKNIVFGKVEKDDPNSESIFSSVNIDFFPKIILYYLGQPIYYDTGFLEENLNLFLNLKLENKIQELESFKEVQEFRKLKESIIFIGDTSTKYLSLEKRLNDQYKKYSAFLYASKYYDDVIFAECDSQDCLENFDSFGGLVSFYNGFHSEMSNIDNFSEKQLINFIYEKTTKIFPDLDEPTSRVIFNGYSAGLFLFIDKQNEVHKKYIMHLRSAAKNLKKAIHLVIAETNTEIGSQVAEILKLKFSDLPKVFIIDSRKEEIQIYRLDKEISDFNIYEFAKNWGLNKLVPIVNSEEIPQKQTFPIITVVGKNYKELVIDSPQDFLIYYYSPKCEPCKKFEKIYRNIVNAIIKDYKDLILFGKINGEANDVEAVSILAYPAIIFYLRGKKEKPVKYEIDDYEIGNFVKFIVNNMYNQIDMEKVLFNIKMQEEENNLKIGKTEIDENQASASVEVNYVEDTKKEEI